MKYLKLFKENNIPDSFYKVDLWRYLEENTPDVVNISYSELDESWTPNQNQKEYHRPYRKSNTDVKVKSILIDIKNGNLKIKFIENLREKNKKSKFFEITFKLDPNNRVGRIENARIYTNNKSNFISQKNTPVLYDIIKFIKQNNSHKYSSL